MLDQCLLICFNNACDLPHLPAILPIAWLVLPCRLAVAVMGIISLTDRSKSALFVTLMVLHLVFQPVYMLCSLVASSVYFGVHTMPL